MVINTNTLLMSLYLHWLNKVNMGKTDWGYYPGMFDLIPPKVVSVLQFHQMVFLYVVDMLLTTVIIAVF